MHHKFYNSFGEWAEGDLFRSFILEIYPDTGFKFYTRTYKKLFLLISDVFPFFNLIYYLFQYFTYYIKLIETKRKLCENIFVKKENYIWSC